MADKQKTATQKSTRNYQRVYGATGMRQSADISRKTDKNTTTVAKSKKKKDQSRLKKGK